MSLVTILQLSLIRHRRLFPALRAVRIGLESESTRRQHDGANKLLGMWRPETIRATVNGMTIEPFGPTPSGLLCFHESLHFVELMSDPSIPNFSGGMREGGSAEEDKRAMIGNLALFGTYTVDSDGNFTGNTVQGCTFPNWVGDHRDAEQLKEVVDGDRMTEIFQSGEVRVEIRWDRV